MRRPFTDPQGHAPPTAERVARRALALTGVACRGSLEADAADPEGRAFWDSVRAWLLNDLNLDSEFEDRERALIGAPLGRLTTQDVVDASWRTEGAAILSWALGRGQLPAHDEIVHPRTVGNAVGFLKRTEETVLTAPLLRERHQLHAYAEVAFAVHWRLREFRLHPGVLDFAEFAQTAWFGPLSLDGVRLVNGDLAIGPHSIAKAPPSDVRRSESIARERHQAANWLLGYDPIYSEVDIST